MARTPSLSPVPAGRLRSRRDIIKQGAFAAGALLLPWAMPRDARSQTTSFDYYISPTGSDSNPGTLASPWAITAINTKQALYAGKAVGLLDGTYNVYSMCQAGAWNAPALVVNGGTSSSPTIIAAVNPRQAIITAADPSTGAYPTTQCAIIGQGLANIPANVGNFILDGLYLTRSYQFAVLAYGKGPNTINNEGGATGIVVRNCEIFDISGNEPDNVTGIEPWYVTGMLIHNCRIHSVQPTQGINVAGIISFNCEGNVYEYNTIYDCNIGIYDKEGPNGNHTHRFNYIEILGLYPYACIRDCGGGNPGEVITSHHNILVGTMTWDGHSTNFPSHQGLVFYNNTVYYGSGGFNSGGLFYPAAAAGVSPSAMVNHYNNIYYSTGNTGYLGDLTFCAGSIALSNYNCYQPSASLGLSPTGSPGGPSLMSLSSWQSQTGADSNSVTAKPTFSGPAKITPAGLMLASGSAGIGSGRVGGIASGAPCNVGAWDGVVTQIGCNFGPGAVGGTPAPVPAAPVLSVS